MNVVGIDDERASGGIADELAHAVKIDEEGEENFVRGWTVLEDTEEIGLE
jgi:hypothetical protein